MPTTNIKSTTPIWLSRLSVVSEAGGNRKSIAWGASHPSNEGPRAIPAIISPITGGCPILRKTAPNNRAAMIITMIWSSRMPSALPTFPRRLPRSFASGV